MVTSEPAQHEVTLIPWLLEILGGSLSRDDVPSEELLWFTQLARNLIRFLHHPLGFRIDECHKRQPTSGNFR